MIGTLFKKDIHRNIEGVIKADNLSDEAIFQEVDEYVVTNDLNRKFDEFFAEYSTTIGKTTQNIGVWISGHFGSGKSHLLKILSYILTDERKHSDLIGELFLEKIDEDDFELRANIEKALRSPSQTILFNIDQKSDIGSKSREDAILGVFMKVFNEMRGYYPKFGYIAKFESDLDKRGRFEAFKEKFEELGGESWESGRETIFLHSDTLAKALCIVDEISEESARDLIEKYEENYSLSIEEFAREVKAYIDGKEPGFRLVFCVDEVGQYIGDNTKLMLNLQTIVETLATVCAGQAWVIVTSQAAVDMLVNATDSMQNDFSKIMGRFKVKLNLTSQNANEVIQKRLLEKTESGRRDLLALYEKLHNSLPSILHFTDRTRQYRGYRDAEHFALVYPFVPYQMDLFQSCITGLSKHNVFQGRHQSTGERSMLDVVQNIAKRMAEREIGSVATFDMFFDGISSIIRGDVQTQIQKATDILDSFEAKVLKALFMVKYVKEFTPNPDNITTLMVDNIAEADIPALKKRVLDALNRLVDQTYIQKVAEHYSYLTDVEKDIEEEIKATEVERSEVVRELVNWIYDDIIRISKVRYTSNRQNYPFARKLDDTVVKGREEELSLNIVTPFNADGSDHERLIHKSIAESDLIVALEDSYDFVQDLELWVKTNKYIPQKQSGNLSEAERNLLYNKATDNNIRREKLQKELRAFVSEARIYYNGSVLDSSGGDAKARIEKAFETVIENTYTYLRLLPKIYEEHDIATVLRQSDDLLTGSDDALDPAEEELYRYIERQKNAHKSTTVANLLEHFGKRPYGWYSNATLTLIASMYMKQKVDLRQNTTPLNKEEVLRALSNKREHHTLVVPKALIDTGKIKRVREILGELYPDASFSSTSTRDIYDTAMQQSRELVETCRNYGKLSYPFSKDFAFVVETFEPLLKLDAETLFEELPKMEDALLDAKEDFVEPLMEFMRGDKRKIYDSIVRFMHDNRDNLRYIDDPAKEILERLLQERRPYRGGLIPRAKQALEQLKALLEPRIEESRKEAAARVKEIIAALQQNDAFGKVPAAERNGVLRPLLQLEKSIQATRSIDAIRQMSGEEFLSRRYEEALERIAELVDIPEPVTTVRLSKITPREKITLKTPEEAEAFVRKLKERMLEALEEGKEILL